MKYLKTNYPYRYIPLSDRNGVAEILSDTYRDYGRGELEHLHDRVNRQAEVTAAILSVVPEEALAKIVKELGFKITDRPKDT